jgi:Zn-dependent protease with chaperone function
MEFKAQYFDGKTSKAHRVVVTISNENLLIEGAAGEITPFSAEAQDCVAEPALGSTRRIIRLPGGGHLETQDNQAVSRIESLATSNYFLQIVHLLESRWRFVVVALLLCTAVTWGGIKYGIPLAAERIAYAIPEGVLSDMSDRTMDRLDQLFFEESKLDTWEKERLVKLFSQFAADSGYGAPPRLLFRKGRVGPNAFALPSGIVVVTDAMVEFVGSDDELLGVLGHELAHHRHRHSLRKMLQDAGVYLIISAVVGDATTIASMAATLPVLLVEASYSREFETEADQTGAEFMVASGRQITPMVTFMQKMAEKQGDRGGNDIMSSHPATQKRIAHLGRLAKENGETLTLPDEE